MKLFGNRKTQDAGAPKKPKKPKKRKRLAIVLAVVVVLLGTAVAAPKALWNIWIWDLIPSRPSPVKPPQATPVTLEGNDEDENPDTQLGTQPVLPEGNYKDDFFTIVLAGTDEDDFHTDVLMVASFDYANKKVNIMSIPRDTQVNVKRTTKKINAAYGVGKGSASDPSKAVEKATTQLKRELQTIIGFEPNYYVVVNYAGFEELVDSIGGVYYDVPVNMTDSWNTFHIKKGPQKLNGADALNLCRYRGYFNADFGRIATVQDFLKVVYKQTLSQTGITDIPGLIDIFVDNVSTDLTPGNLLWFAQEIAAIDGGVDGDNISFCQIPLTGNGSLYKGQYYCFVDKQAALKLINETINPYVTPITSKNVDIIRLLGNAEPGSGTSGSKSGSGTAKTTPKPTPGPDATGKPDDSDSGSTPKPSARPGEGSGGGGDDEPGGSSGGQEVSASPSGDAGVSPNPSDLPADVREGPETNPAASAPPEQPPQSARPAEELIPTGDADTH